MLYTFFYNFSSVDLAGKGFVNKQIFDANENRMSAQNHNNIFLGYNVPNLVDVNDFWTLFWRWQIGIEKNHIFVIFNWFF